MPALLYAVSYPFYGNIRIGKSKEDHFELIARLSHTCYPVQLGPPTKRGLQREGSLLLHKSLQFHQQ